MSTRIHKNLELKCNLDNEMGDTSRVVWSKNNLDISNQRTLVIKSVGFINLGIYQCSWFVTEEKTVLVKVFNLTLAQPDDRDGILARSIQIVLFNNDTLIYDSRLRIKCSSQMYSMESYTLEWKRVGAKMPIRSYVSGNSLVINR